MKSNLRRSKALKFGGLLTALYFLIGIMLMFSSTDFGGLNDLFFPVWYPILSVGFGGWSPLKMFLVLAVEALAFWVGISFLFYVFRTKRQ